jgi:hypothetical protein
MVRFVYKLYVFGHNLDPSAPVTVKPFTPAIFGAKQIANFTTHSYPQMGSILVGLFVLTVLGSTLWQLLAGRVAAARAGRAQVRPSAATPAQ